MEVMASTVCRVVLVAAALVNLKLPLFWTALNVPFAADTNVEVGDAVAENSGVARSDT